MNFLKEFQQNYKTQIDIYYNYSDNFTGIKDLIYSQLGISLDKYTYDKTIRETSKGYKMKYHRDNYMLRKFKNIYLFIPFDKSKTPLYTLIWYKNDDLLVIKILNNKINPPNLFMFFGSKDIHRVNEQLSGKRIVEIYKFYN